MVTRPATNTVRRIPSSRRSVFPAILAGLIASLVVVIARPSPASAAPPNDDFANATILTDLDGTLTGETNADATAETGEPSHDDLPFTPTHSVWYQWTPTVTATARIDVTVTTSWDPVLAIYVGSTVDSLTEIASTHTTGSSIGQLFSATIGTTYRIVIDGYDSTESGTFNLSWSVPSPNDRFTFATTMASDSGSLLSEGNRYSTAEPGEPAHFGRTPVRSVWYEWTPTVGGNAAIDVTTVPYSTFSLVFACYTGSAIDALAPVASTGGRTAETLEFAVAAGTTYSIVVDGWTDTATGDFDISWSLAAAPPNDDFASATVLAGDDGSLIDESNVDAVAEAGEPNHGGLPTTPTHSVWYRWTSGATAVAELTVSVPFTGDWDPVLAVYTGAAVDALTEVASTSTTGYSVTLPVSVSAGTTYHIAVDGSDSTESGSFDLAWSIPSPNDLFAEATVLPTDAGSLVTESNARATAEVDEPDHNGVTASRSVWYRWTPSVTGNAGIRVTTQPYSTWDIVLAVYSGSSVDALTPIVGAGGIPGTVAADVEFRVDAGTTYAIAVDGRTSTEAGDFDLMWAIVSPPNDEFADATAMVGDAGWLLDQTNDGASAEPGEPDHAGRAAKRSVWYEWTPTVDGDAVVKAAMHHFDEIVVAVYTGSTLGSLTEIATSPTLDFAVLGGVTYHVVVDGYDTTDTGTFDLTWALSPPPNDDFADAIVLEERIGTAVGTTEAATPEITEPTHAGVPGTPAHSVWYEWTPTWDGNAEIDLDTPTTPDGWASVVATYNGNQLTTLTEVASSGTTGTHVDVDFPVIGGTTYRIVVDGQTTDDFGTFDLAWSYAPYGGTFTVTKTEDTDDGVCDIDCSLREAIAAANETGGDDTITLPAGHYDLTLGSLGVARETGTTSIIGVGAEATVIDATRLGDLGTYSRSRVISVDYHAGLELVGVTITGGYTVSGADKDGAGVLNMNGTLTITDSIVEGNWSGENGGGISNQLGTATITNSIIRNNSTAPDEYAAYSAGGGIYNSGVMTIVDSTIVSNESSDDGGGVASDEDLTGYDAELHIVNSRIADNTAERGGGVSNISGVATIVGATISDNKTSGYHAGGGGVFNSAETTIADSVIDGNETTANSFYIESGSGGGVQNRYPGQLTITGSAITNNSAIAEQWDTGPLLGGRGGGVDNSGGTTVIENSTLSGNTAAIADRWTPYPYPHLDGGGGGGVAHMPYVYVGPGANYLYCPVTVLDGVTITDNSAAHGGGVNSRWEDDPIGLYGANSWPDLVVDSPYGLECPEFYVNDSIIAGNSATVSAGAEDSWGDYTSVGRNLVGDGTGAPSDGPGDIVTIDPLLSPLADFGGPTQTHAPLPGSPAIDAGATDLTVDQRGVARPQGAADDIGAFEVDAGPNTAPVLAPIGDITLTEGDTLDVPINATDADGDDLLIWATNAPGFATLTDHGDGMATLRIEPGYTDHGSYPGMVVTVSDAAVIDDETITIDVIDANGAPIADDQSVSTWRDVAADITLSGSDPDGDPVVYDIGSPPAHGLVTGIPPAVTYVPDPGFEGMDTFTFTVSDDQATPVPGVVSVTVHGFRPDPGFGTDGLATIDFGGSAYARAVVALADGSVLVAGEASDAVVAKFTPGGTLDPSFGTGGLATVAGEFYDLVVQPDGRIVAVGASGGDPMVVRFDPDGTLDPTFGTGGTALLDLDYGARAVVLQADGKIVIGGRGLKVARLLPDGEIDVTFGSDGVVTLPGFPADDGTVSELVLQPDGAIVLAGTVNQSSMFYDKDIVVARLLSDGSSDPTFDGDGRTTIDLDDDGVGWGGGEAGHGIALQPDGRIVVAGETWYPFDRDAIVLRLTAVGALDASFGADGVARVAFGTDWEQFNDIVVQPDDTILVAGFAGDPDVRDLIVASLLPDGSLNPAFDLDGTFVHDLGGDDTSWALEAQADGKLLLAGESDEDWAVLRLMAGDITPGMLRAMTSPAVPSQIVVDGIPMDTWGLTWVKTPPGDYEVTFTDVPGFTTPAPQQITITGGATTEVVGDFGQRGWLRVVTEPAVPSTVFVDGVPMNDWGMWTNLDPGTYEVCFGDVAGYTAPACELVDVVAGTTTLLQGNFTPSPGTPGPTGHGYLRVTTDPPVTAQVLVDGIPRDTWGLTWLKLPPGQYEVSVTDIEGFTTPTPQTVTITEDATTVVTAQYRIDAWLIVATDPAVPATIYLDSFPRNDWGMWTDLPPDTHRLCYGQVPGFIAPACEEVTLTSGIPTNVTATYVPTP